MGENTSTGQPNAIGKTAEHALPIVGGVLGTVFGLGPWGTVAGDAIGTAAGHSIATNQYPGITSSAGPIPALFGGPGKGDLGEALGKAPTSSSSNLAIGSSGAPANLTPATGLGIPLSSISEE